MKVTIDNLDGEGAVDYTSAVDASRPLSIVRKLNEPTVCSCVMSCEWNTRIAPSRDARILVSRDDGTLCFSGYLAVEPALEFVGVGTEGAVYRFGLTALSDELLLDRQPLPYSSGSVGKSAAQLMKALTGSTSVANFNTASAMTTAQVGRFVAQTGSPWSKNAQDLASASRSVYQALNGQLSLTPVGSTSHSLSDVDGSLQLSSLQTSAVRMVANDLTVCGEREPAAYVTEIFEGDGTTALFNLTHSPFYAPGRRKTMIDDHFQTEAIYLGTWQVTDPGGLLGNTSAGLTFNGGNGLVGETTVAAIDNLEIGGALVVECGGVQLQPGSDGLICALYDGAMQESNCFAGFRVKQSGDGSVVVPIVEGVEAGRSFSFRPGSLYQLRLRIYCIEMQRILQSYYSQGDGVQQSFGGGLIPASANIVMEVQEITNGLPSSLVVLYDGSVANAAGACTLTLVDSTNLLGAIRSVTVTQTGTAWVKSILPGGAELTRKMGTTSQGADCRLETTGRLHFYPTSVPANGELIVVSYRGSGRAVARLAQKQVVGAIKGLWQWAGSITNPSTRSSADCENAASAVLNVSTSRTAAQKGKYIAFYPQLQADVWPGDVLAVNCSSQNLIANLVVRTVLIEHGPSAPEVLKYSIDFANDWAEELSLVLSSTVPQDAWLPQTANVAVLDNLSSLIITSVASAVISVDAGMIPPVSGGFEVRRRDWTFGPGIDGDLVLRSPVRHFMLPREAPIEQYYIRMYDGSTPPNYSRFSSALFFNVSM